ncbi:MAG: glycosyltransferase [Bacteroidales bacterium]|nr:glycosyltransferase [Bacteroidales bacterium]
MSEKTPLVSVCTLAYNHAPYIRECLDGILMQKTNFAFELLIHDDASTDGTADIIREYEAKYPDIIKPIYQTENQYSKGVRVSLTYQYPRAKGKYIALCEGDDYWTDPLKLQKQVDFMEANEEYSLCFHACDIKFEDDIQERQLYRKWENRDYNSIEIIKEWTIPTASIVFRKLFIDNKYKKIAIDKNFIYGDIILFLHLASKGKARCFNECRSVYRRNGGGVTERDAKQNEEKLISHYIAISKYFKESRPYVNPIISNHFLNIGVTYLFKEKRIKGIRDLLTSIKYDITPIINMINRNTKRLFK